MKKVPLIRVGQKQNGGTPINPSNGGALALYWSGTSGLNSQGSNGRRGWLHNSSTSNYTNSTDNSKNCGNLEQHGVTCTVGALALYWSGTSGLNSQGSNGRRGWLHNSSTSSYTNSTDNSKNCGNLGHRGVTCTLVPLPYTNPGLLV
jgi:hypothetical protein